MTQIWKKFKEKLNEKYIFILVDGIIEVFEQKNVWRYSHNYAIIGVDLNGLSYRVKANRRYKDKNRQVVY